MLRFRKFHTAHLSVIASLALSPLAQAQTAADKPTAAQVKEAKSDATEAAKLMKKKQFAEALPKLQNAYSLDPKPATLSQIGTCQRELSQHIEAYGTFERLLETHDKQLSAKDKAAAKKNLDELAKLTGTLRITVSEPGAEVSLDGTALSADILANPVRVASGAHKVSIRKAGFEPVDAEIQVEGGSEAEFAGKLVAEVKTARVRVAEKSGNDVRVFVDGKDVGKAPWQGELAPGRHVIELKGSGFASQKQTIEVAAKQNIDLQLDASVQQGRVKLTATPADAVVLVNGEQLAMPFEGSLDVGTHKVEVSAPGYDKVEREIVVTAELPLEESFALTAMPSAEEGSSERWIKPGILIGLVSLPRPIEGEIAVKLGDYFAVGGQYSMFPNITFPGMDAKAKFSAIQGTLRTFPFGGSFYIGVNGGVQTLFASMSEGDLTVESDMSSPIITPQLGWLWTWDSGFTLGLNLGVQIPLAKDPEVDVKYQGTSITSAASMLPDEKQAKANDLKDKVNKVAKLVGKTPLPQVDLLKIGFFF